MTKSSVLDLIETYAFKVNNGYTLTDKDKIILKEIQTMFRTSGFSQKSECALKVSELLEQ